MQEGFKTLHLFLCFLNGNFAELLETFDDLKSGLASACSCCLITFNYLSFSVNLESLDVCIDSINKLFHNKWIN